MKSISPMLLGALVVWQLVFLAAANLLALVRPTGLMAKSAGVTGRWEKLTGQQQGWSLYAPHVPLQAVFAAVELRPDTDPRWPYEGPRRVLRSDIEPRDPAAFYRPFGSFRPYTYEAYLTLPVWAWEADEWTSQPGAWRQRLAASVRNDWRPMQAFLKWRCGRELACEPWPKQVILLARLYRLPDPKAAPRTWTGPTEIALARWVPHAHPAPGMLPVESFDPITQTFVPVPFEEPGHD